MNYPIVIHKDKGSDYGVIVPDLPGCFSAGATLDEAVAMAREAIELHLAGIIEGGLPIPDPGSIERYKDNPEYGDGTWAVVTIDHGTLRVSAKRINITMPERVLDAVDRFAEQAGETRSGLLVRAVTAYMGRDKDSLPLPQSPRGREALRTRKSKRASKGR